MPRTSTKAKAAKQHQLDHRDRLIAKAAHSPIIVNHIADAWDPRCRSELASHLIALIPELANEGSDPVRAFLEWCGKSRAVPAVLRDAIQKRKKYIAKEREDKFWFIQKVRLNACKPVAVSLLAVIRLGSMRANQQLFRFLQQFHPPTS